MNRLIPLLRGFLKRCPNCGETRLFRRWLQMTDRCPRCGLYFEREEGYWTGAIAINLVITEILFITFLIAAIIYTWPNIPMIETLVAGILINIALPFFFYPISKTIWIAIDLTIHPLEDKEWAEVNSLQAKRKERS